MLTDVLSKYSKTILKQSSAVGGQSSASYLIPSVVDNPSSASMTQNAMDELTEIFAAQPTEANPVLMPNTSLNMNLLEPTMAQSAPGNFAPKV